MSEPGGEVKQYTATGRRKYHADNIPYEQVVKDLVEIRARCFEKVDVIYKSLLTEFKALYKKAGGTQWSNTEGKVLRPILLELKAADVDRRLAAIEARLDKLELSPERVANELFSAKTLQDERSGPVERND